MSKLESAYKTIGEVVKIVGLKSKRGGASPTHTIRYWEKEFKQIKPKILAGNRRYYDVKTIEIIKNIKFLLKDKGMTIEGVKKQLDNDETNLDETANISINTKKPIGNGILTCLNMKQAKARKKKGAEAANAIISVLSQK